MVDGLLAINHLLLSPPPLSCFRSRVFVLQQPAKPVLVCLSIIAEGQLTFSARGRVKKLVVLCTYICFRFFA